MYKKTLHLSLIVFPFSLILALIELEFAIYNLLKITTLIIQILGFTLWKDKI